jgi:hypothetical protein
MKFIDTHANNEHRFSVGRETVSGRCYLAIPVANRLVDYEEYYEISSATHDAYPSNLRELVAFADRCRARLCDDRMIVQPGGDRGVA